MAPTPEKRFCERCACSVLQLGPVVATFYCTTCEVYLCAGCAYNHHGQYENAALVKLPVEV
jgi:hypothetical protein